MAAKATSRRLTAAQIETLTDLMVSKLAGLAWAREATLKPGEISRDEVRAVIVDTVILCESSDPPTLLDSWVETA